MMSRHVGGQSLPVIADAAIEVLLQLLTIGCGPKATFKGCGLGVATGYQRRSFAQFLVATMAQCTVVSCSIRVWRNPASFIQPMHSRPLYSAPPTVWISMLRLASKPWACTRRASSMRLS
jgi:hypothetical protein